MHPSCVWFPVQQKQFLVVYIVIKPRVPFGIRIAQKSTWRALFSATEGDGAQNCDSNTHLEIRIRSGAHPLPNKNRASLNVPWSEIGFLQNSSCMSCGHRLIAKNASPLMDLKTSLLESITSVLDNKPISCLKRRTVLILGQYDWTNKAANSS